LANSCETRTASSIEAATWRLAAGLAARGCGGDALRVRSLVMGRRADDRIEGGRQCADDFVRFLSPDAPVTRIQSPSPWIA
jgi:hypothetical protein